MGSRGPQKTPTARLKLVGSHRAKTREKTEPKPKQAKPSTSIKMSARERRVFDKTYGMIKSMNLHAQTDGNALARYAKSIVLYNEVCSDCATSGESEVNPSGVVVRRTESRVRNELEASLLRLEREFGLTPGSRASLQAEQTEQEGFAGRFIG